MEGKLAPGGHQQVAAVPRRRVAKPEQGDLHGSLGFDLERDSGVRVGVGRGHSFLGIGRAGRRVALGCVTPRVDLARLHGKTRARRPGGQVPSLEAVGEERWTGRRRSHRDRRGKRGDVAGGVPRAHPVLVGAVGQNGVVGEAGRRDLSQLVPIAEHVITRDADVVDRSVPAQPDREGGARRSVEVAWDAGRRSVARRADPAGAESGIVEDHIPRSVPGFADLKDADRRGAQVDGAEGEVWHESPVEPALDHAAGPIHVEMQLHNVPPRTGRHAARGGDAGGVVVEGKLASGGHQQVAAVAGRDVAQPEQRDLRALALDLERDARVGVGVGRGQRLLQEGRAGCRIALGCVTPRVDVARLHGKTRVRRPGGQVPGLEAVGEERRDGGGLRHRNRCGQCRRVA